MHGARPKPERYVAPLGQVRAKPHASDVIGKLCGGFRGRVELEQLGAACPNGLPDRVKAVNEDNAAHRAPEDRRGLSQMSLAAASSEFWPHDVATWFFGNDGARYA